MCTYTYDAQMYVYECIYIHIKRKYDKNVKEYLWMVGPQVSLSFDFSRFYIFSVMRMITKRAMMTMMIMMSLPMNQVLFLVLTFINPVFKTTNGNRYHYPHFIEK